MFEDSRRRTPDQGTPPVMFADSIDTKSFINRFSVENPTVIEAIKGFPTLAYLLGDITDEPQGAKKLKDGSGRIIYYLTQGSGMFGLKNPEDALEWAGIFNHIAGSIRHTEFLGGIIDGLTDEQRAELQSRGYDFSQYDSVGLRNLIDLMFITHAGRRQMDEFNWYGLRDQSHPSGDSYENTRQILEESKAPAEFLNLLQIENHGGYLVEEGKSGKFSNIVTALLTLADWTFSQQPNTLEERFEGLRKSGRAPIDQLDLFEAAAITFVRDLRDVTGVKVMGEMLDLPPSLIEDRVREAYVASSGIGLMSAFPSYDRSRMPYTDYP